MKSHGTPRFWAAYSQLPADTRQLARKAYRQFRDNPAHPSLQFKKIHPSEPAYSVRITNDYRAIGFPQDGEIVWFWIGSHAG